MRKLISFVNKNIKILALVIASAIIGGAATGVVTASIPHSDGTIYGCRDNTTHSLSVIDNSNQTCGSGTTALNWSQNGKSSVVYRGSATNVSVPAGTTVYLTMSSSSWTQASDQINQLLGQIVTTGDSDCNLNFQVANPTETVEYLQYGTAGTGSAVTELVYSGNGSSYLFEPGSATTRDIVVRASSECTGNGTGFTINSFKLDAIGIR